MRFSILPTPADAEPLIEQVQAAHQAELDAIVRYCLLTNYLAAAQIYLKDNFLLKEPLNNTPESFAGLGWRKAIHRIEHYYRHILAERYPFESENRGRAGTT